MGARKKGGECMKKFLEGCGRIIAILAMMITTVNANTTCTFIAYQDTLPKETKKLRKF